MGTFSAIAFVSFSVRSHLPMIQMSILWRKHTQQDEKETEKSKWNGKQKIRENYSKQTNNHDVLKKSRIDFWTRKWNMMMMQWQYKKVKNWSCVYITFKRRALKVLLEDVKCIAIEWWQSSFAFDSLLKFTYGFSICTLTITENKIRNNTKLREPENVRRVVEKFLRN